MSLSWMLKDSKSRSSKSSRAILRMEVTKQFCKFNSSSIAKKYLIPYPAKLCMIEYQISLYFTDQIQQTQLQICPQNFINYAFLCTWSKILPQFSSSHYVCIYDDHTHKLYLFISSIHFFFLYVCFWVFFSSQ